jgi:hypothetical protein
MSALVERVLRRRGLLGDALRRILPQDRAALIDGVMAEAEALAGRNREFSQELRRQLAGNHLQVELSEQPDGLGCFYGSVEAAGVRYRLDVLPPLPLWTGDMGHDAVDPVHWLVMVDSEEVQRAAVIGALSVLQFA